MREEHIIDDLHHDSLRDGACETVEHASRKQALVRCRQSLPYLGQKDQDGERQAGLSLAEDVGKGHDQEVSVSLLKDACTRREVELGLVELELLGLQWEHWGDR